MLASRHVGAATVTVRYGPVAGAPVAGSIRWCCTAPPRRQRLRRGAEVQLGAGTDLEQRAAQLGRSPARDEPGPCWARVVRGDLVEVAVVPGTDEGVADRRVQQPAAPPRPGQRSGEVLARLRRQQERAATDRQGVEPGQLGVGAKAAGQLVDPVDHRVHDGLGHAKGGGVGHHQADVGADGVTGGDTGAGGMREAAPRGARTGAGARRGSRGAHRPTTAPSRRPATRSPPPRRAGRRRWRCSQRPRQRQRRGRWRG